jgi:succinate-semialdehyde dehydrogenase/glutarate-semialdehyde dehydrogenase
MEHFMYPNTTLFINGEWLPSQTNDTIPVINPATEEIIGSVAKASQADVEKAVQASVAGFSVWKNTSAFERSNIMRRAAEIVRDRVDTISAMMTAEHGKTLQQARDEITKAADIIDWFAGEASRSYGTLTPPRSANVQQMTIKVPVGPVAAFTAWNFPMSQVVRKLSAALAAGCSIIIKGPEETPASPAELVQAFHDAGVPAGVISLIYGVPSEISSYLIPHPEIRKISFTGSTRVGKQLASLAGAHMKKYTMELGGHAPVLIFADADIEKTAQQMARLKFANSGQICIAPTRFLVEETVYEKFIAAITAAVKNIVMGNGAESNTTMGPMTTARGLSHIENLVNDAVAKGAKITTGGFRPDVPGYFYAPTVLRDVPIDAQAMNDEPFGPLALISSFTTYEDAIHEANRLPYGLASYAYTTNIKTVHALSNDIEAGMLSINHMGLSLPELHFGGIRDSGIGSEGGHEAINAYFDTKLVTVAG